MKLPEQDELKKWLFVPLGERVEVTCDACNALLTPEQSRFACIERSKKKLDLCRACYLRANIGKSLISYEDMKPGEEV